MHAKMKLKTVLSVSRTEKYTLIMFVTSSVQLLPGTSDLGSEQKYTFKYHFSFTPSPCIDPRLTFLDMEPSH